MLLCLVLLCCVMYVWNRERQVRQAGACRGRGHTHYRTQLIELTKGDV